MYLNILMMLNKILIRWFQFDASICILFNFYFYETFAQNFFEMRNTYMTKLLWQNEYDQTLTIDHDKNWNRQTLRQVSQPVRAGAGGPIQADRTSIFLGGKVNVCHCRIFRSCSNSKFGNIYLVMWISLFEILGYFH